MADSQDILLVVLMGLHFILRLIFSPWMTCALLSSLFRLGYSSTRIKSHPDLNISRLTKIYLQFMLMGQNDLDQTKFIISIID